MLIARLGGKTPLTPYDVLALRLATASAVQVRDRVVRREVPKWAPYAKHLQPLIGALRQGGVEIPELPA